MDTMWQDVRFAFRTLSKNAGFTVVAVLVLALGAGATTSIFSVVNAVLLRPLPYGEPARLVSVSSVFQPEKANRTSSLVPLTDIAEWRKHSTTIESMGAFAYTELPILVGEQAYFPVTALMDPEFLPTLGIALAKGTMFAARTEQGEDNTAIITHRLWVDAFGSDPSIIGRSLMVDGSPFTVRGVLPVGFQFPRSDASYFTKDIELLLPASAAPGFPAGFRQWFGIARLRQGVTLSQAQDELRTFASIDKDWTGRLTPLAQETQRKSREALLITLGIAVVLLLIASSNLMNLMFSRSTARLHEMTIRRAIGGTTWRLLRQMLIECVCIAVLGGFGGLLIASFAIDVLVALSPVNLPITQHVSIDTKVLAFNFIICIFAAFVAGFFPAVHAGRKSEEALRISPSRATSGRRLTRVQQTLCVAQMALGVGLLAAAGLLTHSLWRLNSIDPGFGSDGILGFSLSVPSDHSMETRTRFYLNALDEIRSIPGVRSSGWITFLPPETRAGVFMGIRVDGASTDPNGPRQVANHLITSTGYFSTMRMSLAQGREFTSTDTPKSPAVIVVNETFARRYFPKGDALGQRIGTGFSDPNLKREIVGIVKDTHDRGVATASYPTLYIPITQFALSYGSIALRTDVAPSSIIPEIRRRLARLDASIPLTDFETIDDRIYKSIEEPRFYTLVAAVCAFMAVLFVTLGLYGIVSFSVSRRTPEFGIRMAVGAQQSAILRMVLGQGLSMAFAGVVLGVALSLAFTRILESLLFQVKPVDPLTLGGAALLVIAVTLLASYIPAKRASRVNPIIALRHE